MSQVTFIISTGKQSRRDYELQIAKARSHATRVSSVLRQKLPNQPFTQGVLIPTELIPPNDVDAVVEDSEFPDPFAIQIGGLRTDPFRMFPIESEVRIAEAFDYCKKGLR